jgi:hypothetical protein
MRNRLTPLPVNSAPQNPKEEQMRIHLFSRLMGSSKEFLVNFHIARFAMHTAPQLSAIANGDTEPPVAARCSLVKLVDD